jgi:hypothetical protein
VVISIFFSAQIEKNLNQAFQQRGGQTENMEWRSEREGGNKLAEYGSVIIFAPIVLVAPFPTLVNVKLHIHQMMMSGTYYIKNIYAFFVLIGLIYLIKQKEYRKHLVILSFLFSYLAILAQSSFAISERFHQPIIPFLIIIASFGISKINRKTKKYYIPYLVIMVVIIIGWNWFKLAGRGVI